MRPPHKNQGRQSPTPAPFPATPPFQKETTPLKPEPAIADARTFPATPPFRNAPKSWNQQSPTPAPFPAPPPFRNNPFKTGTGKRRRPRFSRSRCLSKRPKTESGERRFPRPTPVLFPATPPKGASRMQAGSPPFSTLLNPFPLPGGSGRGYSPRPGGTCWKNTPPIQSRSAAPPRPRTAPPAGSAWRAAGAPFPDRR